KSGNKVTNFLRTAADSEAGQMIREYATDAAMQKAGEMVNKLSNKSDNDEDMPDTQPPANDGKKNDGKKNDGKKNESWISQHKGLVVIGGSIVALGLIGGGIYLATRDKKETTNGDKLSALPLY
ncbi:MAG: hypothetical protein K5685_06605, partial [Bacteroidales bacterium]|nr:hypothetical protein [Bacteroidales bacterium]